MFFAWTYKEMSGLDPKVAMHQLMVKHGVRQIKHAQRRFDQKLVSQIETKIDKLIEVGFIRKVKYPTWIENIIPIKKKTSKSAFVWILEI